MKIIIILSSCYHAERRLCNKAAIRKCEITLVVRSAILCWIETLETDNTTKNYGHVILLFLVCFLFGTKKNRDFWRNEILQPTHDKVIQRKRYRDKFFWIFPDKENVTRQKFLIIHDINFFVRKCRDKKNVGDDSCWQLKIEGQFHIWNSLWIYSVCEPLEMGERTEWLVYNQSTKNCKKICSQYFEDPLSHKTTSNSIFDPPPITNRFWVTIEWQYKTSRNFGGGYAIKYDRIFFF